MYTVQLCDTALVGINLLTIDAGNQIHTQQPKNDVAYLFDYKTGFFPFNNDGKYLLRSYEILIGVSISKQSQISTSISLDRSRFLELVWKAKNSNI